MAIWSMTVQLGNVMYPYPAAWAELVGILMRREILWGESA